MNLLTNEEFYKTLNEEIDDIKTRVLLISKLSIKYLNYRCGLQSTRILLKYLLWCTQKEIFVLFLVIIISWLINNINKINRYY